MRAGIQRNLLQLTDANMTTRRKNTLEHRGNPFCGSVDYLSPSLETGLHIVTLQTECTDEQFWLVSSSSDFYEAPFFPKQKSVRTQELLTM